MFNFYVDLLLPQGCPKNSFKHNHTYIEQYDANATGE